MTLHICISCYPRNLDANYYFNRMNTIGYYSIQSFISVCLHISGFNNMPDTKSVSAKLILDIFSHKFVSLKFS